MTRVASRLLVATLVLAAGYVVLANALSPAEPPVPTQLAAFLEPARNMARDSAGPAGWWPLPLRLVKIGCSTDGRQAVLAFDTALPTGRAYAFVQVGDATDPADATVIGPLSRSEFEDPSHSYAANLASPCR